MPLDLSELGPFSARPAWGRRLEGSPADRLAGRRAGLAQSRSGAGFSRRRWPPPERNGPTSRL